MTPNELTCNHPQTRFHTKQCRSGTKKVATTNLPADSPVLIQSGLAMLAMAKMSAARKRHPEITVSLSMSVSTGGGQRVCVPLCHLQGGGTFRESQHLLGPGASCSERYAKKISSLVSSPPAAEPDPTCWPCSSPGGEGLCPGSWTTQPRMLHQHPEWRTSFKHRLNPQL